ncbi:MAG: DUF4160 domain-containing protein [bacterium]|nr:DUF4160 domain-containing protein [bacterium]
MPVISMFYGIIISLYYIDNKQHNRPHIHVKYQEHEAVVAIPEGETLAGEIPRNRMRLVQAWIEIHRDELIANWELAVSGQPLYKIDPLR